MFLSQKSKNLNDTILANCIRFVSPENQLISQKTVKKKLEGSVFKEKYHGSSACNQIYLQSHNLVLRVLAGKGFRCFKNCI